MLSELKPRVSNDKRVEQLAKVYARALFKIKACCGDSFAMYGLVF